MKALNPTLERLEERIAPGLLGGVTTTIGGVLGGSGTGEVSGGAGGGAEAGGGVDCRGTGNGSSASNSHSSKSKSTKGTDSGTCQCGRHSH